MYDFSYTLYIEHLEYTCKDYGKGIEFYWIEKEIKGKKELKFAFVKPESLKKMLENGWRLRKS